MRNRLAPTYDAAIDMRSRRGIDVDAEPGLRLIWLGVALTLPLLVVAGRLIHLQGFRSDAFVVEEATEQVTVEDIPARNGRILSADGQLLAFDEERYRLLVQYRWLEEPPDDRWLHAEAISRLSRAERRDKKKVEQAKTEVLTRRDELWRSLAELTEVNPAKLTDLRNRIQTRVERVLRSVESRREESPTRESQTESARSEPGSILEQAWDVVRHELTTSPTRDRREPVRISEQTDHHLLLDDVDWQIVAAIETNPQRFPGVKTDLISRRVYPRGDVAPHVLGYRQAIGAEDLAKRKHQFPDGDPLDYRMADLIGKTGVERSYESALRGVRGLRRIVRDRHGAVVRSDVIRPARPGRDVVLNLSLLLQTRANSLLHEVLNADVPDPDPNADESHEKSAPVIPCGACLVALDVRTGAVLASASAPSFDINTWLNGLSEQRALIEDDPRRPLFSRATQAMLPPGSVFKTVSAVAAIESGKIDPDRTIECRGYLDQPNKHRCYIFTHYGRGHGATELTQALAMSCNVYFFNAARTIGPNILCEWADRFGFGLPTGIDLPGEQSGRLPRPPDASPASLAKQRRSARGRIQTVSRERLSDSTSDLDGPNSPWDDDVSASGSSERTNSRGPWYPGDTLGLAIGQSRLTATPMQIGRLMAAVANDGWLVTPHVAKEVSPLPEVASSDDHESSDRNNRLPESLRSDFIEPPKERIEGLSEGTLARVREGLEQVVSHPQGTGFKTVRLKEVAIAGKTGTAEIGPDRTGRKRPDHAWFAGYVPADRPQIAFVVVLEQAGSGGKAAGPVARKFVQALLELGLIQ